MVVSCDQGLGRLDNVSLPCFPAVLLTRAKKWIWGGRKRLSGLRRGVSLPRSIGESNPVLMFHSSQCLFYVFTFYFKCLFIWHRQRALKNADKQRLGSIFICTWSQGEERKKKIPRNLMQNQSPALCLSPTFCSAVNASSLMLAWLELRKKSAALTLISFLFQYCCTFFISQCVHVLNVCLSNTRRILKSLVIIITRLHSH